MIIEDNAGDPKSALSGVNKLIESDSIDLKCTADKMLKSDFIGVAGSLKFDEFRSAHRPDLFIQIRNGIWTSADL